MQLELTSAAMKSAAIALLALGVLVTAFAQPGPAPVDNGVGPAVSGTTTYNLTLTGERLSCMSDVAAEECQRCSSCIDMCLSLSTQRADLLLQGANAANLTRPASSKRLCFRL